MRLHSLSIHLLDMLTRHRNLLDIHVSHHSKEKSFHAKLGASTFTIRNRQYFVSALSSTQRQHLAYMSKIAQLSASSISAQGYARG